jgi:diguanylate cyclase (GGDEF)-like protein
MRRFVFTLAQRWFRFTSPASAASMTVFARERVRKARLLSIALLPVMIATLCSLVFTLSISEARGALLNGAALLLMIVVARLNRHGQVYGAGFVFLLGYLIACSLGLQLAIVSASNSIAYDWLYLTIVPLVAGFILPSWMPFLFGLLDIIAIVLIYGASFSRHSTPVFPTFMTQITFFVVSACFILAIATLTAIYARSVAKAVVEADRAKELEQMHHELEEAYDKLTKAYGRLEDLATHDPITGLLNHRALQQRLQLEVAASETRNTRPVSVIFADIDHFKQVNDTWGHQVGDIVLEHLAECLSANVRAEDIVGRYGGEEFVIVMPGQGREEAMRTAERLRTAIARSPLILSDGREIGITLSIGVAVFPNDGRTLETIIAAADIAMYEAKRRGRNQLVTFAVIQDRVSLLTSAQIQAVNLLLKEQRITIAFQPIWDLAQDAVVGFEALMRPDPHYGLQGPQEAFDVAERMGNADDLDALCRQAILARARELPSGVKLFMNVLPQTLGHNLLARTSLADAVIAAGLTPERVVLEITERTIEQPEVVVREAARLRQLGFQLALDDAGAGNAGLEMLGHLAVDYVKIDKSIVVKASSDIAARAVLAGILAIARRTQSYVIAEGIEDLATLRFIQEIGLLNEGSVNAVQGYLIGRPSEKLPTAAELMAWRTSVRAA